MDNRSIFSYASSSKHGYLSSSAHELPRWRTPSPMAASVIPAPIVQSTYTSSPSPAPRVVVTLRPTPLQDRQEELEADLQFLLDAQAEALIGGIEGGLLDDRASNGSTTPTAQSLRSVSAEKRHRPTKRKIGVRSARKGIYNAILALSEVKAEEMQGIDEDARVGSQAVDQIDGWVQKKHRLQEASKEVGSSEDSIRGQRLRQEADVLQEEINHVELQLADMKGRHRKLLKEVAAAENAAQAKLASYTSSLRLLEEDVQKFLSSEPATGSSRPTPRGQSASVWQLPPKRRTLDLAKQYWEGEYETVRQQRQDVDLERSALDEGAALWKGVVVSVSDFERTLRTDMATKAPNRTNGEAVAGLRCSPDILTRMDELVQDLDSKVELARTCGWNLLIAAIGAEMDALQRGRTLLGGGDSGDLGQEQAAEPLSSVDSGSSSGDEIRNLDKSFETARRRPSNVALPEDDPDPELLFSRHEFDSE